MLGQNLSNHGEGQQQKYMKIEEEPSVSNLHSSKIQILKNPRQFSLIQENKQQFFPLSPTNAQNENLQQREQSLQQAYDSPFQIKHNRSQLGSPRISSKQRYATKKMIEELNSLNISIKQQLNFISDDKERKLNQIQKLKMKTAQAQSDKIELMRDLATYESNFCESSGIRSSLLNLYKKVEHAKNFIKDNSESKSQTWMDKETNTQIDEYLEDLDLLKQRRGSISDNNGYEIFAPKNVKKITSTTVVNLLKKKHQSLIKKDFIYVEEQLFLSQQISGLNCQIHANINNDLIQIVVSISILSKSFKIELKTLNNKQKIQLQREVERLYFNVQHLTNHKVKLSLAAREDYEGNFKQALVQLQGTQLKWCQMIVQNESENNQTKVQIEVRENIYEVFIDKKEKLEDVIKEIENNYIFKQTGKDSFQICNQVKEAQNIIPVQKLELKISKLKNFSQSTMDRLELNLHKKPSKDNLLSPQNQQKMPERAVSSSSSYSSQYQVKQKKIIIQEDVSSFKDDEGDDGSVSQQTNDRLHLKQPPKSRRNKQQSSQRTQSEGYTDFLSIGQEEKRHKSEIFDKEGILKDLQVNKKRPSSQQKVPQRKQILQGQNEPENNVDIVKKEEVQQTQQEVQLKQFEFFYHYKWYVNNLSYHKFQRKRQAEQESIRKLQEEEQLRIRQEMENAHDQDQITRIIETLYTFRSFFKGPTPLSIIQTQHVLHTEEFQLNETSKIFMYFFESSEPNEDQLTIIINKVNIADQQSQRRSSQSRFSETLQISSNFLNALDLYAFHSIDQIKQKLDKFASLDILKEIVKYHIQANMNENKAIFKTFEQSPQATNFAPSNPIRKMESEIRNAIQSIGDRTSSEYGDTSMNESYSRYLK